MRYAAFLLLLCACSSLSSDERKKLATHQSSAQYYYQGGLFDQAMGQVERGLALDPDDYKLNAIRGTILLRRSGSALGQDHRRLDEATECLARVYEARSPSRHEPYLLLSYALALQKQGRRNLGEEITLRDQATRANEPAPLLQQADAAQQSAQSRLQGAREVLGVLVERGELLRRCHYHLLLIAQDLRDWPAFDNEAKVYLEQLAKDQAATQQEVDRTDVYGWEQEQLNNLAAQKQEELDVRALLAEHHFLRQNFPVALTHLDRVLELDPSRSVDYFNRGKVLLELRRNEAAKEDFRRFLRLTNLPPDSDKTTFAAAALAR